MLQIKLLQTTIFVQDLIAIEYCHAR